jgi:hypothetical protein
MTGSDRHEALRQALRIGPVLAVAAVTGYLLGGCGGGDLSGVTGLSGVTELPTGTRPTLTVPTLPTRTETAPGATTEAPTTAPEPTTTTEPTTTVTETETTATEPTTPTTAVPTDTGAGEPPSDSNGFWGWLTLALAAARGETTTSESPPTNADTNPTETVAPEATSSETVTPWGWIALAVGLALAALVVGVVVWRRRRAATASWSSQLADLSRRSLVATDDVVREGSVVTGHVQALASEARSLEGSAADDRSRTSAARLGERLDELVATLEADRALRLSSPPPSEEQLSYSTALIREQVTQLQGLLEPPSADEPPA